MWKTSFAAFLLLAGSFVLIAQEQDSMSLHMNELIITADKFQEKRKDLPRQIDVIDSKTIKQLNKQNTGDLLFEAGNVYLQKSQQGGGSPILRGFEANKVLLVLDGVRLNNAIYRGGHLQNVLRIEQSILEKIEVLYGPGSLLYGSDALGGVVNFVSLKPSFEKPIRIFIQNRNSSVNQESSQILTIQSSYKNWAALFHYSQSDFGDLIQGKQRNASIGNLGLRPFFQERLGDSDRVVQNSDPNKQVGSAYRQQNVMFKLRFKPKEYSEHLLSYYYTNTSDVPRYDRLSEFSGNTPLFAEWYYGPEKFQFINYQFNHSLVQKYWDEMRLNLSFQQINESRNTRNFSSPWLNQRMEKVNVVSVNLDFKKHLGIHEIKYGLEYNFNQVNSEANALNIIQNNSQKISTRYPDGGSLVHAAGAYFTISQEWGKKWVLTEGVRANFNSLVSKFTDKQFYPFLPSQINETYFPVSANIGLVYMPNPKVRWYANMGNAYRVPNVDDMGKLFDSRPGRILVIPNKNLKPEQTITYELGVDKRFYNKIQMSANIFITQVWNSLIIKRVGSDSLLFDDVLTPVFSNQNAQRARIVGYHLSIKYLIDKHWKIEANLNQSVGNILGDSVMPLDHIPPMYGRIGINYTKKKLEVNFQSIFSDAKHRSRYYLNGEDNIQYATFNGLPAWYILSGNMAYSFLKQEALKVRVGIENILDRNYRTFASGISAPGRNFYLSVSYQLN